MSDPDPTEPRARANELAPCPSSPNCVSSRNARDDAHHIAPFRLGTDPASAWQALRDLLHEDREFEIVDDRDGYMKAVATTRFLRFKDDVEFLLDIHAGHIGVRSASRIGYSDFGKNRKRMESIRDRLIDAGVVSDA